MKEKKPNFFKKIAWKKLKPTDIVKKKPIYIGLGALSATCLALPVISIIVGALPSFINPSFSTNFSANEYSNTTFSSVNYDDGKSIKKDTYQWRVYRTDLNNFTSYYTIDLATQQQIYQLFDKIVRKESNGNFKTPNLDLLSINALSQEFENTSVFKILISQGINDPNHLTIVAFSMIERFLLNINEKEFQTTNNTDDYINWNNLLKKQIYIYCPLFPSQLNVSQVGGFLPSAQNKQGVAPNTGLYELQKLTTGGLGTFRKQYGEQYDWFIFNQLYQDSQTTPTFKNEDELYGSFDTFSKRFSNKSKKSSVSPYEIFINPQLVVSQIHNLVSQMLNDLPLFQIQIRADYFVRNAQILSGYQSQDLNNLYGGYWNRNDKKWYAISPWSKDGEGQKEEYKGKFQANELDYSNIQGFQAKFSPTTELSDSYLRPADYAFFLVKSDGSLITEEENINGWKMEYISDDQFDDRRFSYIYKNVSLNWLKHNYESGEFALSNPFETFQNLASIQEKLTGEFLSTINTAAAINLRSSNDNIQSFLNINYNIDESQLPTYRYYDSVNKAQKIKDWQHTSYGSRRTSDKTEHVASDKARYEMEMGGNWFWKSAWPKMTIDNKKHNIEPNNPIANIANGIRLKSDKLFDLPAESLYVLPPKQKVKMSGLDPYLYRDEEWNEKYDLHRSKANSGGFGITTRAWRYWTSDEPWTPELLTRYNTTTSLYFENYSAPESLLNIKSKTYQNQKSEIKKLITQNPTIKNNEGIVFNVASDGSLKTSLYNHKLKTRSNSGWMAPATYSRYLNLNLTFNPEFVEDFNWNFSKIIDNFLNPFLKDLIVNNEKIINNNFSWSFFQNLQSTSFALVNNDGDQLSKYWPSIQKFISFLKNQFKYISPNGFEAMPERSADIISSFLTQLKTSKKYPVNINPLSIYKIFENEVANMADRNNLISYRNVFNGQGQDNQMAYSKTPNPYKTTLNGGRYLTQYYDNTIIQEKTLGMLLKNYISSTETWWFGAFYWDFSSYAEELESFGYSNFLGVGGLNVFNQSTYNIDKLRNPLFNGQDVKNVQDFNYIPDNNYFYGLTSNFWKNKHTPWNFIGQYNGNNNTEYKNIVYPSLWKFKNSWNSTTDSVDWNNKTKIYNHYSQASAAKNPTDNSSFSAINQIFIGSLNSNSSNQKIWNFSTSSIADILPNFSDFLKQNLNDSALPETIIIDTYSPLQSWLFNLYQNFDKGLIYSRGFVLTEGSFKYTDDTFKNIKLKYSMLDPQNPIAGAGPNDEDIPYSLRNKLWDYTLSNIETFKILLNQNLGFSKKTTQKLPSLEMVSPEGFEVSVELGINDPQYIGLSLQSLISDFKNYMVDIENNGGNTNGVRISVLSEVQARYLELLQFYLKIGNQKKLKVSTFYNQLKMFDQDIYQKSSALYRPIIYLQNRLISWFNYLIESETLTSELNIQSTKLTNAFTYYQKIGEDFDKIGRALYQQLEDFDKMVFGTDENGNIKTDRINRQMLYRNINDYSISIINLINSKNVTKPSNNNDSAINNIKISLNQILTYLSDPNRQNNFSDFKQTYNKLLSLINSPNFDLKLKNLTEVDISNITYNIFIIEKLITKQDYPELTQEQAQNHTYDVVNLLSQTGYFNVETNRIKVNYGKLNITNILVDIKK